MDNKYLDQAMEFVKAQASVRPMTPDEMFAMRDTIAAKLATEAVADYSAMAEVIEQGPICDPKTAIKESSITCLVCGKKMRVLTAKHLATHGLTPETYREKYGYKKGQPLACKSLSRERRNKMKDMRLWLRRKKNPAKVDETPVKETPAEKPSKPKKSPEASAS